MSCRILITGSTDGIGAAAAAVLVSQGHAVFLHARNSARAQAARENHPKATGILTADLTTAAGARSLAEQINSNGPWDAIIHNAGLGPRTQLFKTDDGHASTIAVNTLAPYIATCLMEPAARPKRLLYLSSSLHYSGSTDFQGVDASWKVYSQQGGSSAYNDSKLHDVILSLAVSRKWTGVQSGALDPGWIATKMGTSSAPGKVETPARAIAEFAAGRLDFVGDRNGAYFTPQGLREPVKGLETDKSIDDFLERCERATGVKFPSQ